MASSQANDDVTVVSRPTFLFHNIPSPPYCFYFSPPPPFYFNLPPPPSFYVYYPLSYFNPNYIQEHPPLFSPTPRIEQPPPLTKRGKVFNRRSSKYGKKSMWRKKKIEHQVESNDDHITTVMLRNIPNKYTREMMIEFMDKHCEVANETKRNESPISAYDFLYLPIDFNRDMNLGYAFVNFTNAKAASEFKATCNYKPWSHFSSKKILEIANARIQGKDELVNQFKHMTFPYEEYTAVSFSPARTGSKNTVQTVMVGICDGPMISV